MKRIVCIVVTYNGAPWIEKCLRSLLDSSHPSTIVVIDNGSRDATPDIVRKFPPVRLIETGRNLGFGQANNIGLKIAVEEAYDYAFLLNQDAWVEPDTLSELVKAREEDPAIGILSPLHLNGNGDAPDANFLKYLAESELEPSLREAMMGKNFLQPLVSTGFVNAAAWLLSLDCLKRTGGFDPIFFHYGEDRNYLQRALFHGFRAAIHTGTRICHDREQRIRPASSDLSFRLKKDWEHFLIGVCDIREAHYRQLFVKRGLRHLCLLLLSLVSLKIPQCRYHHTMLLKIIFSFPSVNRSRRTSLAKDRIPHLC